MLTHRTLALIGGFWPYITPPPHGSGRATGDSPLILLGAIAIVIIALVAIPLAWKALSALKRARLRKAMEALPRRPSDKTRCIVAATVTSGAEKADPCWNRPAVWFRVALMAREVPHGETHPRVISLDHPSHLTLTAGDATIDIDGRNLEPLVLHHSLSRHAYSDQLPEHLREIIKSHDAPLTWSDGSPVLWFISASVIRVGDALTVMGTAQAAAQAGTEVEANAAASGESGYREGPAQRTYWRVSSGPGSGDCPVISSHTPEAMPAAVAERPMEFSPSSWLTR